ncbi:Metallo-dependent phosphatase [Pisolithus orientalis]|uniref:Metallo-dependent phosphatase n=1 Tax=Pisolithus orientalis TaxID=936130 RepID=UPI002224B17A|nr:Metallo-dependent phosphatase [Pisolithus orientalis]KAI5986040.1 Metallo-dependent phosphatase [Pisolithus orientalis]
MWSAPDDIDNWAVGPRGAGWLFVRNATREVHLNSLSLIARGHQLVQEGCNYMFDNAIVTLWSAPSYWCRYSSLASVLALGESGEHEFKVFGLVPENEGDMRTGKRNVSIFCYTLAGALKC